MVTQVLDLLEQHRGGLGAREISRRLGIQPSALDGLLDWLVRKGRLVKLDPCDTACGACPLQTECNLLAGRQPRYVFVGRAGAASRAPARHGVGVGVGLISSQSRRGQGL